MLEGHTYKHVTYKGSVPPVVQDVFFRDFLNSEFEFFKEFSLKCGKSEKH